MKKSYYKTIVCNKFGTINNLKYSSLPSIPLNKNQVRIQVKACGINFPDKLMIEGRYQLKPTLPFTPGMELSGIVSESYDKNITIGSKVICQMRFGAYSEEVVVDINDIKIFPNKFSFEEAAGFSVAAQTAYVSLVGRANVLPGQIILILGATGGVGLAAIQLGKSLGAIIIAVCGNKTKQEAAIKAGANYALSYEKMIDEVKEITNQEGVDIIYDPIGGEYFLKALKTIKWGGKILIVGFASGSIPSLPLNIAIIKGISVLGVRAGEYFRQYPSLKKPAMEKLLNIANKGLITPIIYDSMHLRDAIKALKKIENREVIGRLILKP